MPVSLLRPSGQFVHKYSQLFATPSTPASMSTSFTDWLFAFLHPQTASYMP